MSALDKLEIITGGIAYDVSDLLDFALTGNDGFGMAPFHRLEERGPQQDGVTDRGFRLDPRVIGLKISSFPDDLADYYALRDVLLRIFRPRTQPLILRRTVVGLVRQCDCHLVDGGRFSSANAKALSQDEVFQLKAGDPTLYDPVGVAITFSLGGGSDQFVVPTPVPTGVGASTIDQLIAIAYAGSWRTYPFTRITGPITDCVITNTSSGDKLDFTGITIAAGNYYDIDLAYDKKTVVNAAGDNKIADLTDDSNLVSFCILDDGVVADGTNSIRVTGSAINQATKVDLSFYTRYIGM